MRSKASVGKACLTPQVSFGKIAQENTKGTLLVTSPDFWKMYLPTTSSKKIAILMCVAQAMTAQSYLHLFPEKSRDRPDGNKNCTVPGVRCSWPTTPVLARRRRLSWIRSCLPRFVLAAELANFFEIIFFTVISRPLETFETR